MSSLHQLEIIILLLMAVLALTTIARKLTIPYPIILVVGGLGLSFIPTLPEINLDPDLVFFVFMPPLLWAAAYFTSWRDFRVNARPIALLAIGLVMATTAAVASIAHALFPGMGWAEAIVLGAIVSPPDAVSATAIVKQLNLPHRVITILEGESLLNDATALVLYRAALIATSSGKFELNDTIVEFLLVATLGIAVGFAIGILCRWVLSMTEDSFSEIAITLLAPYIAWVLAEQLHASSVLACVVGGLYLRQHFSAIVAPLTRIQSRAVWDFLVFILNGIIFILIGLHLVVERHAIAVNELALLTAKALVITVIAIMVRLIWVPVAAWLPRALSASIRAKDPAPPWSNLFIIGWAGMRGIVSLAAALALPFTTEDGNPFPFRAEIILITFMVILITLVMQGLSLPLLIRKLNFGEDKSLEHEERHAREHTEKAALNFLDDVVKEGWPIDRHVEQLRVHYKTRRQFHLNTETPSLENNRKSEAAFQRLQHGTLTAERLAMIKLRDDGEISDEILLRLEHELDLESLRIGIGEWRLKSRRYPKNF
jgi:monovalent cation/hydrogen antiporter